MLLNSAEAASLRFAPLDSFSFFNDEFVPLEELDGYEIPNNAINHKSSKSNESNQSISKTDKKKLQVVARDNKRSKKEHFNFFILLAFFIRCSYV